MTTWGLTAGTMSCQHGWVQRVCPTSGVAQLHMQLQPQPLHMQLQPAQARPLPGTLPPCPLQPRMSTGRRLHLHVGTTPSPLLGPLLAGAALRRSL